MRIESNKIAPMTNGDKLRTMTDEELANSLYEQFCPDEQTSYVCDLECKSCWLRWLQQPVDAIALEETVTKIENELRIPADDVVKVVRCKDCIYNENGTCTNSEYYDEKNYRPDYFCADGKRREQDA